MIEPAALRHHVAQRGARAEVDALEVHVLHAVPRRQLGRLDRVVVGRRDAGVVEGDVEPAELVEDPVEERVDGCLVGDVRRAGRRRRPRMPRPRRAAGSRSAITTTAPSAANRRAVASPMPLAPPVMMATRSFSRWVRSIWFPCSLHVTSPAHVPKFTARRSSCGELGTWPPADETDAAHDASVAKKTFLVSVKCSAASGPSSRPRPEAFMPPNGVQ